MQNQSFIKNPMIFFTPGVLLGLFLTVIATWADLESAYYGFDRTGGSRLSSLNCPILMAKNETGRISVNLNNPTDGKISPAIKTDISSTIAPISFSEHLDLAPGESAQLEWQIGPDNVDLGQFIFARVWVYSSYPIKDKESTCGVFVLPIPGNGMIYTLLIVGLSLFGLGVGLYSARQARVPGRGGLDFPRLAFLAIVITAGVIASFMGIWLLGVLFVFLSLLVTVISIGYSIRS